MQIKYPDTDKGVRDMLKNESVLTDQEVEDAFLEIDPHVSGCWLCKATKNGEEVWYLCYVADHPDANNEWFGSFEEVEIPEDRNNY
jgi:hypothetical protein